MAEFDDLPDLIEDLGAEVAAVYYGIESAMIQEVAAELRAGRIGDPLVSAQLAASGARQAAALNPRALALSVVTAASRSGADVAAGQLRAHGQDVPRRSAQVALDRNSALVYQMTTDLQVMTTRIARWMPNAYRTASSMLTLQDQQEGVASRYLSDGITAKTYANGRRMPIGSYAEVVARSVTHQASVVASTVQMQQTGFNLCSIITGIDACQSCASNRGKVWSLDGTPAGTYQLRSITDGHIVVVEVAGALAAASSGTHFRGPNCRCQVVTVLPGLSIPVGTTYSPQAEAERDRQRQIERNIRMWKNRESAALNDDQQAIATRRRMFWQREMSTFISDTGRNRRSYREQVSFSTGKSPSLPRVRPPALAL